MLLILNLLPIRARLDNIRVEKPLIHELILRKAHPGYLLLTINGKVEEVPIVKAELKQDNRTPYLKKLDEEATKSANFQLKQAELDKATEQVTHLISPAQHAGAVARQIDGTDRSYMDDVVNGSGIVSELFKLEHPALSTLFNTTFDLAATPFITKGFGSAYNSFRPGNLKWSLRIPRNADNYYRIVGSPTASAGDAIADANLTGQLRSSLYAHSFNPALPAGGPLKTFNYMMFSKGKPWEGSTGVGMGIGKGDRVIVSKAETPGITWEQSNVDFKHKGHAGIFRPRYEGLLSWVPNENFVYYERGPFGFGWMRRDFTNVAAESLAAMNEMLNGVVLSPRKKLNLTKGELSELPEEIVLDGDTPPTSTAISDNPVRRYLLKLGIDDTKYTDEQLRYLIEQHREAVWLSQPATRHVVVDNLNATVYDAGLPRGGARYGYNDDGMTIGFVGRDENLGVGFKGISEDAYNGLIQVGQDYFKLPGVISGLHLLSPEITVDHIWPKFNKKTNIGNYGRWEYNHGRDVTKTGEKFVESGLPVMLLYGRSNTTPIKSTLMFDPRAIQDGKFVIDWNNSNPFMKKGGKLCRK